jgi:hypothetical protein
VASVFSYGVAYFLLLAHVMLRGLPEPAPRARVAATYLTAVIVGLVASLVVLVFQPYSVAPMPLLLLIVPAVAAGDRSPAGALWRAADGDGPLRPRLGRVDGHAPVLRPGCDLDVPGGAVGAGSITGTLLALALAAPVAWPFSALFIRALYGDLTGRTVVARRTAPTEPRAAQAARGISPLRRRRDRVVRADHVVGSYQRFSSASRRCTVGVYTLAGSVDRSWKLM